MLESEYQGDVLIPRLRHEFPGIIILKNDEQYIQGFPDLTLLWHKHWAVVEVKASIFARYRPNQEHYLDQADRMSVGITICPENEDQMIDHIKACWGVIKK